MSTAAKFVLVAVIGYGAIRLWTAPDLGSLETVAVVSFTMTETHIGELNELLAEDREAYRKKTQDVHAQYLAMTETAIADGAEIVLWPELAVAGLEQDVQAVIANGQALARQEGIYLAMPAFTVFPDSDRLVENVLFIADPNGNIAIEHVKYGGNILEGTMKGSGAAGVATLGGRGGGAGGRAGGAGGGGGAGGAGVLRVGREAARAYWVQGGVHDHAPRPARTPCWPHLYRPYYRSCICSLDLASGRGETGPG